MSHVSEPATIEIASPKLRAAALAMLHIGPTQAQRMLAAPQSGQWDFAGLFVARRGPRVVGSAWGQRERGRTAFCWPPCLEPNEPAQTAARLQESVDRFLDAAGIILTQAILADPDGTDARRLAAAGYRYLTDLAYLVVPAAQFPRHEPAEDLSWIPLDSADTKPLAALVEHTYQGSLDCPELDGVRAIDEVLEGYRATGRFVPAWWLRVQQDGTDVGCLILADHPEHGQAELVYLGVVPAARGRGLGRRLTRYAQWLAAGRNRQRLVLAVDATNWPARQMYEATGFHLWDRRSVFIRVKAPGSKGDHP